MSRFSKAWWLLVMAVVSTGASCPRRVGVSGPPAPVAFATAPTLDQITQFLASNAAKVQSLQTTTARLKVPGAPKLGFQLAWQRPKNFRMQASLGFTGAELDLGSNDTEFWFWAKRNEPPALYFARHADAQSPGVQHVLPLPPTWITEALGLVEIDPSARYEGPYQRTPGYFEIRAVVPTPTGNLTKVYLLDNRFGYIVEQTVYDAQGRIVALARESQHVHLPEVGVSLPRAVEVQLPTLQLEFQLEIDGYQVNALGTQSDQLWIRPQFPGSQAIDLATGYSLSLRESTPNALR